ncbi:MAG: hypothetical protein K2H52_04140 [Lachnospiraceae bacterium]|nr:hypothetical protein [Lachnospiraceae bacterium]MDE6185179.1 hypothetical protein [Lachnospiraceae bacterium]
MRTKLFIKNSIVILVTKVLCYLAEFVARTVLIRTLPMEYVGVTGLFTNILTVLSLSELGFGTVLVYSMYVPIAQNDEEKLLALTTFYKKVYRIVAMLVAIIGGVVTPFLPYIIKDCPDLPGLSLFYLLYLANTVLSYTFTYRQSLFLADQKMYVTNFYSNLLHIMRTVAQIVVLVTLHNFTLYLLIQLPFTLCTNLLLSHKAKKAYPFLTSGKRPTLSSDEKTSIFKNVYAMFYHRLGYTVANFTDNLLISFFLGLTAVSQNSCYTLLITFLKSVINPLFSSLNSGIGNYYATKTKEETYSLFNLLYFAGFWFYTFCTISFFLLVNPFISFVWGDAFLFPLSVVLLISANFYVSGVRMITVTFKEALGILYQDRYRPIAESLLNLLLSILLVRFWGISGIFAGTLISMLSTSLWVEVRVLFHYGFQRSAKPFWLGNVKYLAAGVSSFALTFLCSLPFDLPPLALIGTRILLCLTIPNLFFLLFFHRSKELRNLIDILKGVLRK